MAQPRKHGFHKQRTSAKNIASEANDDAVCDLLNMLTRLPSAPGLQAVKDRIAAIQDETLRKRAEEILSMKK